IADHGGQRRGLTGAGTANDDHQAALGEDNLFQNRRQVELFERGDLRVDETDDTADRTLLYEGAHAEAPDAWGRDGEVTFLRGVKLLRLAIVHDRAHQRRRLLRRQGALALGPDFTVDFDRGRKARGNEQIRGFLLGHPTQ